MESNTSGFIQCGEARIKISNIKNYGIKTNIKKTVIKQKKKEVDIIKENEEYRRKYEKELSAYKGRSISKKIGSKLKGTGKNVLLGTGGGAGGGALLGGPFGAAVGGALGFTAGLVTGPFTSYDKPKRMTASETYEKEIEIKNSYLYITTFQNDNFEFHESKVDFDIFEKCKEIDERVK